MFSTSQLVQGPAASAMRQPVTYQPLHFPLENNWKFIHCSRREWRGREKDFGEWELPARCLLLCEQTGMELLLHCGLEVLLYEAELERE